MPTPTRRTMSMVMFSEKPISTVQSE